MIAAMQPTGAAVGGLGAWGYVGLVFNLGLVLVAIWAAVMAMRWYVRRMNGEIGGARQLQVLESRALGPNRSLHLVRLADRAVLLGVTADRINALLTVDDPAEVERMVAAAAAGQDGGLRRVAGDVSSLAGISLRSVPWQALLRRVWPTPPPRTRTRTRPQGARPAAPVSTRAGAVSGPADSLGSAMQRASVAAAYGREASIMAAQRAIAQARAADAR
jgi:flagellar biosynthetic protein FliO